MKRIRVKVETSARDYPEDLAKIVEAFKTQGLICTLDQAHLMWSRHSDDYCAGWLILPKDPNDIVETLVSYFEVLDGTVDTP